MAYDGSAPPAAGIFGLDHAPETAEVILVPVPWEATTSYGRGTARGPDAIHAASVQVDLFDVELGSPHERGIALLPADAELRERAALASEQASLVIDAFHAGERVPLDALGQVNKLSLWLDERVGRTAGEWLDRGKLVGVIGGDHSVAYGAIEAHRHRYPAMGVLQIDAHADLRVAYQGFVGSHASVMHRVVAAGLARLVSVGVRDLCREEHEAIASSGGRVRAFFDAEIAGRVAAGEPFAAIARDIAEALPAEVYVSFDVDGLDPTLCPHTGTPVPGGLSFHQLVAVLDAVVRSGRRIVGFDLCEVAPGPDEWDANVGARVLYKLVGYGLRGR